MTRTQVSATTRLGIIAGAAGGLAEVAWVTLYAGATGGDPTILARGVTTAAGISALLPQSAATLGIAVHMLLAMTLGVVLTFAWRAIAAHRSGPANPYPFMLAALAGVWAVNFLAVLPLLSPAFIEMLPYTVSLTSKLLFAAAAATIVHHHALSAARVRPASIAGASS
jgi:hypothetical protein